MAPKRAFRIRFLQSTPNNQPGLQRTNWFQMIFVLVISDQTEKQEGCIYALIVYIAICIQIK